MIARESIGMHLCGLICVGLDLPVWVFVCCPARHDVFLQTRRFTSKKVREVVTRDMRASLSFATDRKLEFPVMVEYTCPWEPQDSGIGPGILYLAANVVGDPEYHEFGPIKDSEGQLVEQSWANDLRATWGEMQEHYNDGTFTKLRVNGMEHFFNTFPWGGLKDVHVYHRPPFQRPTFQGENRTETPLDPAQQQVLDSVGLDMEGNMRIGFADGKDTLIYPLAVSRPVFGNSFLDGTKKAARQRKRKGE